MNQIVVLVSLTLHPEDADTFQERAMAMMAATRAEAGCLEYTFSRAIDNPQRFLITECWQDTASLEAHFATAHMLEFRQSVRALRIEGRQAKRYAIASSQDL
jgi:quinol monooxygenase YgiN